MRSYHLILSTFILAVILVPSAALSHGVNLSGKPLGELEAELRADPRLHKLEKIEIDDRIVLAAVLDVGSGTYVWVLQIYVDLGSVWGMVILQRTNSGDIAFDVDEELSELLVTADGDDTILRVPFASLKL